MKIATFSVLLGSAVAFAPAQNGRAESTSSVCAHLVYLFRVTTL